MLSFKYFVGIAHHSEVGSSMEVGGDKAPLGLEPQFVPVTTWLQKVFHAAYVASP